MAIANKIFKFFADIIFKETGIVYSEGDYYRLESRLNNLSAELKFESVEDMYNGFSSKMTPEMKSSLIDIGTNNETFFFRDGRPFTALVKQMIPEIIKKFPNEKIRIWSAASSSGQEAYSIIMALEEHHPNLNFEIIGTDICEKALAKAKSGHYTNLECQRGLKIERLLKYFDQNEDGNSWTVKNQFKERVRFSKLNLYEGNFSFNYYHICFLRNVLIYQNVENREKILANIYKSLKPGGYLVMGNGESLTGVKNEFQIEKLENYQVWIKPLA